MFKTNNRVNAGNGLRAKATLLSAYKVVKRIAASPMSGVPECERAHTIIQNLLP